MSLSLGVNVSGATNMDFIPGSVETKGGEAFPSGNGGASIRDLLCGNARGFAGGNTEPSRVAIVGTGPGDPDLLTVKALRIMSEAEVVIHDRLIGPRILDFVHPFARRIDVGKAKGEHSATQERINGLMVHHARAGRRVVRLKGGDPFVFGRGGEELEHLHRAGIEADVVPGITAATGCAAATGIPLTHREFSSAVTFVTGHGKAGVDQPDWAGLARLGHTIVIYMGVSTATDIADALIANGMDRNMPVAVVENGTRPDQKTARGAICDLPALIEGHKIVGPAIIIVGEVAALGVMETTSFLSPALAV